MKKNSDNYNFFLYTNFLCCCTTLAPSSPAPPIVERLGRKIFARWEKPVHEGGGPITRYVLQCVYSDTRTILHTMELSAHEFSKDVTELCESNIVQFQVQAVNVFGASRFSTLSTALHSSVIIVCGRNENGRM